MPVRYRILLLIVTGLMMSTGTALAGKPRVTFTPVVLDERVEPLSFGSPSSIEAACQLGILGAPATMIDYFLPPNDSYFTFLRKANCADCTAPAGVILNAAHLYLEFREDCPMAVTVSIVGVTGTPSCPKPDPSVVRCGPTSYLIDPPGTGTYNVTLALPPGCCVTGDAFLRVTIDDIICTNFNPRLVLTNGCIPCQSWNFYPPSNQNEACAVGFAGNYAHYVDADCCVTTPARMGTWGRLKTLHR
jgi:hypothetical protein